METIIFSLVAGGVGFLLGWFLKPSSRQAGDLSMEGEGALRAEADSLRARVQDLEGRLSSREGEVSELKTQLSASGDSAPAAAAAPAKTSEDDETYALEWQNRYLAARVKYLESRIAEEGGSAKGKPAAKKAAAATKKAPAKKAAAKKAPAKKTAAKKSAAKKAPAKKAPAKKAAAKTAAAPKKTAAKSKTTKAKSNPKMERAYKQLVEKYDAKANKSVFESIYKYCGIAMNSRDASLVACKDEEEVQKVADSFVTKKLGVTSGQTELVQSICEQMKASRLKNRAVFYYLTAKKARKLGVFK